MNEPALPLVASASQTVGPFFHVGPGASPCCNGTIATRDVPGQRLRLRIQVLDGDGAAVTDALVELRQADAQGVYTTPPTRADEPPPVFSGFGRLGTSEDGSCLFETIRPGRPAQSGVDEAAHIDVCLFMRGLLRHLYTRIYFEDDATLDVDPVLALVPPERRDTLMARPTTDGDAFEFVVRLQGERETVFFDL